MQTWQIRFARYSSQAGRMYSGDYWINAETFLDAADRAQLMARCFNDAAPQFEHCVVSLSDIGSRPLATNTFEDGWRMLSDLPEQEPAK